MSRFGSVAACAALFGLVAILSGCGPQKGLERAKHLEKKGEFYRAWERYQVVAASHPTDPVAAEALFRAGWIAERHLNDCYMAGTFYERVLETYPQSDPWAPAAAIRKTSCPDFFPLVPAARWVKGDSDTLGKNARVEMVCEAERGTGRPVGAAGIMERTFFAGDKAFQSLRLHYRRDNNGLHEHAGPDAPGKTVIAWPAVEGTAWTTRAAGRLFRYRIVAVDQRVRVAAGEFDGCIKVGYTVDGTTGQTLEYYAPGVGRVLTAFGTATGEKRNMELLSYDIPDAPDFPVLTP